MKKTSAENIKSSLPSFMTNLGGYLKSIVSLENKKDLIGNATGTIGFLIQLFGKPLIDGYYSTVKQEKLKDFGFKTYAYAAFKQSAQSLEFLKGVIDNDTPLSEAALGLEKDFISNISQLEKGLTVYVFQPKYHPAIQLVKQQIVDMLEKLKVENQAINTFKKNFNDNIEKTILEGFSDYYDQHKQIVKDLIFQEKETELLINTISNSKIGFVENEDLKYEDAFGAWIPISTRTSFQEYSDENQVLNFEKSLKKVERLIEEYFSVDPENHLEKVLFVVADFGKGKSVFLKRYAASLAKKYLETGEGYFPIYFNLRSFSNYSSDTSFGIIEDYLLTEYGIKISSDYFKAKKFTFLIDSLDESCDLSKAAVDKVLNSVKRIQNIDKTTIRSNRLIITTRPFDDVLFNHINQNKPYLLKIEKSSKEIGHFLSLYGFKKDQFNDWIFNTLKVFAKEIDLEKTSGFVSEVIKALKGDEKADIYSILFKTRTLSAGELRRPIFAYMIYQLLINNINITQVGKIGIYLSFLNLLTKEAKYVNDPNLKINLQDQFEARNILHQIAPLWLYEKEKGKQGSLKKADLCRMIGNYTTIESDAEVIEKYKTSGFSDIEFLSHSYFGENNSVLHFQHQSFAEVLLAEYYLKVLIKSALDRPVNVEFVISKLNIGRPTSQTIEFFIELLQLLKETISDLPFSELTEKRKLLTPLLASIAIVNNNRTLNSEKLFYQWYQPANINKETNDIPVSLLEKWCINEEDINNIIDLCEEVIKSGEVYLLSKSTPTTSLIKDEITHILNKDYDSTLYIDKYLSLIVGTTLYNADDRYFIRRFSPNILIKLLKNAEHDWLKGFFKGISFEHEYLESDDVFGPIVDNLYLHNFDFSDARFKNVTFYRCIFKGNDFQKAQLENVSFPYCTFYRNKFSNIRSNGIIDISAVTFEQFGYVPYQLITNPLRKAYIRQGDREKFLFYNFHRRGAGFINYGRFSSLHAIDIFFYEISFYVNYCLQNEFLTENEIIAAFPTRKPKFKARIKEIVLEIKETGFFKINPVEQIDDLPF